MMKSHIVNLIIFIFSIIVTDTAIGQQNDTNKSLAKFPKKYSGDNVSTVIDKAKQLSKKVPKKSEFETTEQYMSRLKTASESVTEKNFTFVFRPRPSEVEYDADKNKMTISIKNYDFDDNYEDFILKDTRKITGSYVSTNGFGAKVRVTKINQNLIRLQNNAEEKYKDSGFGGLELGMMHYVYVLTQPDTAKNIKSNLAVAYTAAPVPHYYELETQNYGPSYKDPREVALKKQTLYVEFKKISIFNYLTGEIYGELNIDDRFNKLLDKHKECLATHKYSFECSDILQKPILELEI